MTRGRLHLVLLGLLLTVAAALADDVDGLCKHNDEKATSCLRCASLEFNNRVTFEGCCSDDEQFLICEACYDDPDSCKTLMEEFKDLDEMYDESLPSDDDSVEVYDQDYSESSDDADDSPEVDVQKRFGKLFIKYPKRYGRIFFGKRSSDMDTTNVDKRYGRLYMSSGALFGKRSMGEELNELADESVGNVNKRYGRIFVGRQPNLYRGRRVKLFGKRSDPSMDFSEYDKRYGRLFTNSKYLFGKRGEEFNEDSDQLNTEENLDMEPFSKRYGSLFVSKFGKRDDESMEYDDQPVDKRFGRLYMNRMRLYSRPPKRLFVGKRFGRLFTNRRKNYFG